jgi:hypothetical protein
MMGRGNGHVADISPLVFAMMAKRRH